MNKKNPKAHQHRRFAGREDLAGENPLGDTIQAIFLILFLAVWILDSFVLKYSTFLADQVAWYIRWPAALIVLVLAFLLAGSGSRVVFGEQRDPPRVITNGAFSLVRHPIYLGAIMLYLGTVLLTLSLLSAALWVLIIVFYRYISRYEESLLINIFGDEYRDYKKRVPMLFPIKFSRQSV